MADAGIAGEAIAKRRRQAAFHRDARGLAVKLAAFLLAMGLALGQVLLLTQVRGQDMFPSLKDGDLVLAFRLMGDAQKDDLVVLQADGQRRVMRVVARGGDVVTIDETGNLLVNGTNQAGEIMYPTYVGDAGIEYPYAVPAGHVFVLGDYRTEAEDSRHFGAVPEEDVEGEVIAVLRRRGL